MPSSPRTTPPSTIPRSPAHAPLKVQRTKAGLLNLLDAVDVGRAGERVEAKPQQM